jgi:polyhydroxyalkanoate synthesis regulator phasin
MEVKETKYLFEGLSETLGELFGELYDTLIAKGKKRMGQEDVGDSPQVSELIKRTRENQSVADLISKGQKGQEELIQSIGGEVKKILSSAGIVTRTDLARIERRIDEIENALD